ncbi:MAG: molecular chaperone TorD family protein, partial [Chloroflexota bacterium]|nr:molecular chaperone TorD family protein [Chloroflexota bacterium]
MTDSNTATIARAETYLSFARLFLLEPGGETLAALQNDARFAEATPFDARALRVEFTRLFTLNVFPYASVFLDAAAALGTETTARVEAAYDRGGFEIQRDWPIGAPDHFGAELAFVAHLLHADREPEADRFLAAEVLPWAGIFLPAVEQNAQEPFYRVVARAAR